ncbi:MAG: thiamine/thiamine pyrophosphate ABC transporter permease ThiP [Rhodobacteraceae bacterium]|nr:thiamine/thiamine pyrophosphate ABC transporter permease ThiP [Paracoccaceae bacterium]
MADRAQPLIARAPGRAAAGLVLALVAAALAAVVWRAEPGRGMGPSDWAAVRFTVVQALWSAAISVALAVPLARALARRRFAGRNVLVSLLGAPFILPALVAVLGLLAVFGRGGWISAALNHVGLGPLEIYGLHGVVLAHVFFNLPLATRLLLQGWQSIPAERFRLAAQLGFAPADTFRLLERPMLARAVPGALAIVFALCLTSFAVALTLGGGPHATTVELAIYQAFRFDFDLGRAAVLSCLQIAVAGAAGFVALRLTGTEGFGTGLGRATRRWDAPGGALAVLDAVVIAGAVSFLALPLLAVVASGLPGVPGLPAQVWRAAAVSVGVALLSTLLMLALALPMACTAAAAVARAPGGTGANTGGGAIELAGLLGLVASPLVIGTGLFIWLNPVVRPADVALGVTALVNAVMALPFALRILVPRACEIATDHARLALMLNMAGWHFLRRVMLPRMRPRIGFAAGLTAALSMGDLGVVTLFADPSRGTLPLEMYRLMGAYRMDAAAAAGLVLLALALALFWALDRWGRGDAEA